MNTNLDKTTQERCYFQWGVFIIGKSKFGTIVKIKLDFGTSNRLEAKWY